MALRYIGVRQFRATSGLGVEYVCHVGDFSGEAPFYQLRHSFEEILLMTAWCRSMERPVIFDVGANNGFLATQLAQLLRRQKPRVFAFEPVPSTFAQLRQSVQKLGLEEFVAPICCAISDSSGVCTTSYDPKQSLFAQIGTNGSNARVGDRTAIAAMVTIDEAVASLGLKPCVIKVDVEGFELRVLRGAAQLISSNSPPAVSFEWNPVTMSEVHAQPTELAKTLSRYTCYYISDFEGQRKSFGERVDDLSQIDWVCNIFAVPEGGNENWQHVLSQARQALAEEV
jgi:FkbM family methyltransferase